MKTLHWITLLFLAAVGVSRAQEGISVQFRVSWHQEQDPLDTLPKQLKVPHLHVIYQNDTDTAYYLIRQDQSCWIFPLLRYYSVVEALPRREKMSSTHYVPKWAVQNLRYDGYSKKARKDFTHQLLIQDQAWEIDLTTSIIDSLPMPLITYEGLPLNWSETAGYLQCYIYYRLTGIRERRHDLCQIAYAPVDATHSVAVTPVEMEGELRPQAYRLAFLPARSSREYVYSLLPFSIIRGRYHVILRDWEASDRLRDERIPLNVIRLRDSVPVTTPPPPPLPSLYEGYHLYRGRVRGDSIWIKM